MTTHQPIPPSERVPAPTIAFEPAKLRRRYDGWTAEKQIRFVEALAATKCVDEACRIVGMSDTSAYTLRNRPCGEVCSGVGYRARLPDTGSRAGRHEPRPLRSPPPHLLQGRAGRRVSPFRRAPDHVPAAQPAPEALRKMARTGAGGSARGSPVPAPAPAFAPEEEQFPMTLDDALEFIAISAPEEHGNLADEWQEGFYVEVDVQAESSGPRVGQQSWQTSARGRRAEGSAPSA